ncbi:Penicillin-binding protein [Saliniradius amylolyticus]|uniref:Peptidoglycan D,D-transpeptidase MrdA n=1 Tax=Saliniradius amylolyticus TaxID=2183582 RepID=A0A2S2E1D0_9ALTE|nr:penicillin-binding protein 2 [Saliniradius amylolyticus]AWL11448.1 Penicillin-binding protein [Saliniradius amylolyticus]
MPPKRITIRDHTAEANLFARRTVIALLGALGLMLMLVANLHHLQMTKFKDYQTRSNGNRIKVLPVAPNRGMVYDRNGEILAENRPTFSVEVIPEQVENLDDTLIQLQSLLDLPDEALNQFRQELKTQRRFKPVTLKSRLSDREVALLSANQHRFPGVSVEARLTRYYPYGETLTHLLGYVAKINKRDVQKLKEAGQAENYAATYNIGKQGIEKFHETQLHGEVGYQEVEVNNQGRIIRTLNVQPPVPGNDIILNVDVKLQQVIHDLMEGHRGSVVVLDPNDGGVLALYSNPSYDPNLFVHGISSKNYNRLLQSPDRPLINRATQGQYPPASTVKPHLALLGLDSGVITSQTRIYDRGVYQLKGVEDTWRDWKKWGHGWVDVTKSIEVSCDTFFYDMAYRLGIDRINEMMSQFGFGQYTGIDLYEEYDGNMPSRGWKRARYNEPWYVGDTISVGIGQSYWTATPLQLAKSIATLVNRGQRFVPQLERGRYVDGEMLINEPKTLPPIQITDPAYWDIVLDAMYGTVNRPHGTARRPFEGAEYISAGKTGTAQVVSLGEDEEYDEENIAEHLRDNAMYVGYAPYENPGIVIAVAMENAGGGSSQAAPIARQVMDYYFEQHPELIQKAENEPESGL